MDTGEKSIRLLMLPGHIPPFLTLAKSLAKRNFFTYICSSSDNLHPIRQTLSPKDSISIKLVQIPIPIDQARPAFSTILKTLLPDLILYDCVHPWAPEEASLQNIPAVLFITNGAASTSVDLHHFAGSKSDYPFREMCFTEEVYDDENRIRILDCVRKSSGVVLIRSIKELEGKYIDYLCQMTNKAFVPVGALVEDCIDECREQNDNDDEDEIMEFLAKKSPRSTVFASFGSEFEFEYEYECFLSEEDVEAIATGLEKSGVDFIWVLGFPRREENIPEGFLERVSGRGMVVPIRRTMQRKILCHPSVGGFMSNCGWSRVIEGVFAGVPVITVPMHNVNQSRNGRVVQAIGVGEEVRKIDGEEVGRVVRKVVVEREGAEVRRKAAEMRGKGEKEMDGVVEELVRVSRMNANVEREDSMKGLNEAMGVDEIGREGVGIVGV